MILRLGVLVTLLIVAPGAASEGVVRRALADEMARTLQDLRLGEEPGPYFISYRLDDLDIVEVGSSFGSPLRSRRSRDRVMSVEVRVGSPQLDNTNFFSFAGGGRSLNRSWNGSVRVPLEDSYAELRRQAWLLTDAAYKRALENLARKSAALEARRVPGDLPDFLPAAPAVVVSEVPLSKVDPLLAQQLTARLSRVFRRHPAVHHSVVRLRFVGQRSRYLNSDGSWSDHSAPLVELVIAASTQADDGTPLVDAVARYGRSLDDLPALEPLEGLASELAKRLAAATDASEIERYNGPVLFSKQAAAELFHQVFAPQLSGWRPPVAEDERLEQRLANMGRSLNDRIGGRVLARSMRLVDDARVEEVDGARLYGGFPVDDEGVPASQSVLVERGILKTLVSSRAPSRGVAKSSGNRRGAGALVSNLLLETSAGRTEEELRDELMQLVEERELEFGVIVRRLANPLLLAGMNPGGGASGPGDDETGLEGVVEAVKVFPDGREEVIRSPRFAGLAAASFRDIVAASTERFAYNAPLRSSQSSVSFLTSGGLGSLLAGPPIVGVVVPDLLFEELTITAPVGPVPKAPVISHPFYSE